MTELTLQDLAERWSVSYNTLKVRRHRGQLPEPDKVIGRTPVWYEDTIEQLEDRGPDPTGEVP